MISTTNTAALNDAEMLRLITSNDPDETTALFEAARKTCAAYYKNTVYFRGLIEFTNRCKNDCYYCGLRISNRKLARYRLSLEQVLDCCEHGDALGYKTFVLQGGDDPWFTDDRVCEMVSALHERYPYHAITLSLGERCRESYEKFFRAGANRYLLRHETADIGHYSRLHPESMSLATRKQCLYDLKDIGYQVGAGFMVGSPFQTSEMLLKDLRFLQELQPQMVGIGPFIPQSDTPFGEYPQGSLDTTLRMIALCRLLLPKALIPATAALGTISPKGRELGLMAGANVVMPNLSPIYVRDKYALYNNKIFTGDEAAECMAYMEQRVKSYGFVPDMSRGDYAG